MAKESMTTTRLTMVGIRSRDLLWMFTVCTIVNIPMLYLISLGEKSVHLPMTVMIVLVNILNILGMIDAMDDLKAAGEDFDEQDHKSNIGRRFEETEWGMFNLFTDAARMRGSVASRRGVENKSLQFALADGGFSGVADSGFNRSQFARQMKGIWEDAGLEIPTKAQARLN